MIKILEIPEWTKKVNKLKKKYKSPGDLLDDCNKRVGQEYYTFHTDPLKRVFVVMPRNIYEGGKSDRIHVSRDCPTYNIEDDGRTLTLVDTAKLIKDIIPKLVNYVDVKLLLKDTLQDQNPEDLVEIHERLTKSKKKAKVTPAPRCFYLAIGGKPGATFDLFMRE